jgi:uncharacterized protein YjbI with pentapeptide repeats
MANDEHVALLKQGVAVWNAWRDENSTIKPDLRDAVLSGADLRGANLGGANLRGAHLGAAKLSGANLRNADLSVTEAQEAQIDAADLSGANLSQADLSGAELLRPNLSGANLSGAIFVGAHILEASLSRADLSGANLQLCILIDTDLTGAVLTGCLIYGVSAWRLKLDETTKQQNLIITDPAEPKITVDNIEVAQFIYLMLHNQKVRDVIDTITSKAVLILGRFTEERKSVLDAIREELRRHDYLPILFDFDKPANRDVTETISLLARMARFVVADITDAKAIPQELNVIVPDLPSVPVQPLLLRESSEYGMFEHYARYPWVLPLHRYETPDQLIAALGEHVIEPAERKALELRSGARPIPPII